MSKNLSINELKFLKSNNTFSLIEKVYSKRNCYYTIIKYKSQLKLSFFFQKYNKDELHMNLLVVFYFLYNYTGCYLSHGINMNERKRLSMAPITILYIRPIMKYQDNQLVLTMVRALETLQNRLNYNYLYVDKKIRYCISYLTRRAKREVATTDIFKSMIK